MKKERIHRIQKEKYIKGRKSQWNSPECDSNFLREYDHFFFPSFLSNLTAEINTQRSEDEHPNSQTQADNQTGHSGHTSFMRFSPFPLNCRFMF